MAFADFLDNEDFSLLYAVQNSGLNTAATTGWVSIPASFPSISEQAVTSETVRATGARGASADVETGRKYHTLAFSVPLHGQPEDYDFTTDSIVVAEMGALHFLQILGGADAIAYAANNVTAVDGNTINLATGALDGCLVAYGAGTAGTIRGQGFVTDSATPATTHLFEDLAVVPTSNDERYPTLTLYPSTAQLAPVTMRLVGSHSSQDLRFVGCHISKIVPREEADRIWLDIELICYGGLVYASSGGIQFPADYLSLQPLLARGGARTVVGSNVIAALDDGTAGSGTCGLKEVTLSLEFPHEIIPCDAGNEGVEEIVVLAPRITGSLWCPKVSNFEVSSQNIFDAAWKNKTKISLTRYLGDRPGAGFSWKVGRASIVSCELATNERQLGYQVNWKAAPYKGDASSNDAGNKVLCIGLS